MKATYPPLRDGQTPTTHHTTACAYGGWYLFAPLKEAVNVARYLREGQQKFVRTQLSRLARMFDIDPS